MPIGHEDADADRGQADHADGDRDPHQGLDDPAVEPLQLAPAGIADRARFLVDAGEDIVGAAGGDGDAIVRLPRLLEAGVGAVEDIGDVAFVHLLSIASNGDEVFSSRPWATPSARAM